MRIGISHEAVQPLQGAGAGGARQLSAVLLRSMRGDCPRVYGLRSRPAVLPGPLLCLALLRCEAGCRKALRAEPGREVASGSASGAKATEASSPRAWRGPSASDAP